jgi:hypothetical protein
MSSIMEVNADAMELGDPGFNDPVSSLRAFFVDLSELQDNRKTL